MSGMWKHSAARSDSGHLKLIPLPPLPHSAGSGGLRPDADLRSQCWTLVNVMRSAGAPWAHPGNRNCGIYNDNLLVRTSIADYCGDSQATEEPLWRQAAASNAERKSDLKPTVLFLGLLHPSLIQPLDR